MTPLCHRPGGPDLVSYFSLPGGILTSLALGGFENSLVNFSPPWCRILVSLVRRAPLQVWISVLVSVI